MKIIASVFATLLFSTIFAQNEKLNFIDFNTSDRLQNLEPSKIKIGGYGQVDYSQALVNETKGVGTLDVHRLVLFLGYSFNQKWEMVTEIELEHVQEIFVEQAYLTYKHNKYINFKGGLILIPMGYINEYHEPPSFFGVERPLLDTKVVPTTWREIGIGIYGRIPEIGAKYQLYVVNGFIGYDDVAKFDGASAYRNGRQKGAESLLNYPNLSGKIELFGIKNIKLGLSGYFGKSQSSLVSEIAKINTAELSQADSSVITVNMIGLNAAYNKGALQLRTQAVYSHNNNVVAYNAFGKTNLGKELFGYYFEASYAVYSSAKTTARLVPFLRFENFDTQFSVDPATTQNSENHRKLWTAGLSFFPVNGLVLKADYQWINTASADKTPTKSINVGFGYMF
jgi:opacity protein-like surface antigen